LATVKDVLNSRFYARFIPQLVEALALYIRQLTSNEINQLPRETSHEILQVIEIILDRLNKSNSNDEELPSSKSSDILLNEIRLEVSLVVYFEEIR
jgi:hypothetical protein